MTNRHFHKSLPASLLGSILGLSVLGCASGPEVRPVAPVQVSDDPATPITAEDFARETHQVLLSEARDQETKLLLAGVVQYQLLRAERLFDQRHDREAEDVVAGALLLLRHDDELTSATRGRGRALLGAAHAAARAGDAGRAEALYEMTLAVSSNAQTRKDVTGHLEAISKWNKTTAGDTSLEQVGANVRRELSRAIVDPRAEVFVGAQSAIVSWMRAALSSRATEGAITSRAERELAMEAYRAIQSGAPAMIALNARQGAPAGAITALEDADLERALSPSVRVLLEATVEDNHPDAWHALFRQLEDLRTQGGAETRLPKYVTDGAVLWSAIQLYRSSPGQLEHSMPLAMVLVEFGMAEVASSLLSQNSDDKTRTEALTWSLSLVMRGLLELSRTDQLEAARRSFEEALPLLQRATRKSSTFPGLPRAQALMAALESRHGYVTRARRLLEASTSARPETSTLQKLARLYVQAGDLDTAIPTLRQAIAEAQKDGDLLEESKAQESLFRTLRTARKYNEAKETIAQSLKTITVLRNMGLPSGRTAEVERHYARILEYYGREREVRATYDRALEASRRSAIELEITLTEMARAAITRSDLRLARKASDKALTLGLPEENSVYIALWQQMLETQKKTTPDGLSHQILSGAHKAEGWVRVLRKFGAGELKAAELENQAQSIPEKTEALFYLALAQGGDHALLRKVATSPAIDLIEVRIAQDLLSEKDTPLKLDWPLDLTTATSGQPDATPETVATGR